MVSKVNLEPAWILHRRPWRESSLLVEAFSRDHGRVALVAKGARAARSQRRGMLEPFQPLALSWTQRGEMATLTTVESGGPAPALTGRALWCGFYCNELLLHLLVRDDPAPEVWQSYSEILPLLADNERQSGALRKFELSLLAELGVVPDLSRDAVTGEHVAPAQWYELMPESGPVATASSTRGAIEGKMLLTLAHGDFEDAGVMHAARRITRAMLDRQLGGRKLKSREMFL